MSGGFDRVTFRRILAAGLALAEDDGAVNDADQAARNVKRCRDRIQADVNRARNKQNAANDVQIRQAFINGPGIHMFRLAFIDFNPGSKMTQKSFKTVRIVTGLSGARRRPRKL